MTAREIVALLVLALACFVCGAECSAAQTQSVQEDESTGAVYLHETFEEYEIDNVPECPQLQRVEKVTAIDGSGKVGSGKVAHFNDSDTSQGGAMEYNLGKAALGCLYIEFDAINNDPAKGDKSSTVIFAAGPWGAGKSLVLNSKAKRAFGFEMYQQKYLKLRVGSDAVTSVKYDSAASFNVKIWANDSDKNTLSYKRPDNGESAELKPDSVVVWMNNALFGELNPEGTPMHGKVTKGDAVLGRVGFSSSSTKVGDFLIDNLHVEDPSDNSKAKESEKVVPSKTDETTLNRIGGAETMAYRDGDKSMNLFVFKPEGWDASNKRSAFIYFFGGGWTRGTPQKAASMARWAARQGMVGIAPDYRTKDRFGTSPLASVDDARAAFSWVQTHAKELGIDPQRVAVGGSSAGGHVAMWTAIKKSPPGSDPATSPKAIPAIIFLTSAVTDTSPETGYTSKRFGDDAMALSPVHQLDTKMPPVLMVHAANDDLVHYSTAVALHEKLTTTGNECELVTVPAGGHGFTKEFPQWKQKSLVKLEAMFESKGLLPAIR